MAEPSKKQKLYRYVDESGQDTKGDLFLVALVVTGNERDELLREAERIEQNSGKYLFKWRKIKLDRKIAYLRAILSSPQFAGKLFFARYTKTKGAYLDLMAPFHRPRDITKSRRCTVGSRAAVYICGNGCG